MVKNTQFLTTAEFGSQTGLSSSKVSKLIREGQIKAEKKSGKWMIDPDQLQAKAIQGLNTGPKPTPQKMTAKAVQRKETSISTTKKAYAITEFAEMTFLTEFGVMLWLKQGLLSGRQNENGDWLIDGANLEIPAVKRLIREDKKS